MRENTALRAWRDGKTTIGGWLQLANAHTAESLAALGFDWLCIDMQHGLIDYSDLTYMLPAISTGHSIPLVRVPWNEPYEIMKALDAGAYGVIVPMVNNRAEAEQAIQACRYPPDGLRSFGPIRAAQYGGAGYADEANGEIACIAMIETREALDNLEEIISTPGLDAVYIGPSDLALALGLRPVGDFDEPTHIEAVNRIFETCRAHNVATGIHTSAMKYTQRYVEQGFQFVTLGADSGWMARSAFKDLREIRDTAGANLESTGY